MEIWRFYFSQYKTVPFDSLFIKQDEKSVIRLERTANFQSIFSILMRSQRNFDSDKNAFYCTAYSSLEYSSLNMSTFKVIEDFFFCFWSELNIIFDWRQRVWLFTGRELFIVSAERQTKQNPKFNIMCL